MVRYSLPIPPTAELLPWFGALAVLQGGRVDGQGRAGWVRSDGRAGSRGIIRE